MCDVGDSLSWWCAAAAETSTTGSGRESSLRQPAQGQELPKSDISGGPASSDWLVAIVEGTKVEGEHHRQAEILDIICREGTSSQNRVIQCVD